MEPRYAVVDVETSGCARDATTSCRSPSSPSKPMARSSIAGRRWCACATGGIESARATSTASPAAGCAGLPGAREALTELAARLDGKVFTAHNADFDADFIERAASRAGVPLVIDRRVCTLDLAQARPRATADARPHRPVRPLRRAAHGPPRRPRRCPTAAVLPYLLGAHALATQP